MRKGFKFVLLAAVAALGLMVSTGDVGAVGSKTFPLAYVFDIDGEPPDADQVLVTTDVANGALTDYGAPTANPDVCRLVDMTLTDADSSINAGSMRLTGTDCWGDDLVASYAFNASGTGVKTFTVTTGKASGAYFRTVTKIESLNVAGADGVPGGDDVFTIGYTTQVGYQFPIYGVRKENTQIWGGGPTQGIRWVDPAAVIQSNKLVANNAPGTASALLTAITLADNPFTLVSVGDLIYLQEGVFQPGVTTSPFLVVAKADNAHVTLDRTFLTKSAGVTFSWKKRFISSDPQDGYIAVGGNDAIAYNSTIAASGTSPGGTDTEVECGNQPYPGVTVVPIQTSTHHVASGAAGAFTDAIDLRLSGFSYCRFGVRLTTGDDADVGAANTESITAALNEQFTSVQ